MSYPILIVPFLKPEGIALFPFILIKNKTRLTDKILIRHETIHLKQQLELLVFPFYILYLFNYLINLLKYKNRDQAYYNIVFEREAYRHDKETDYLKKRPVWAWLSFR